jgi:hypothetical protein
VGDGIWLGKSVFEEEYQLKIWFEEFDGDRKPFEANLWSA